MEHLKRYWGQRGNIIIGAIWAVALFAIGLTAGTHLPQPAPVSAAVPASGLVSVQSTFAPTGDDSHRLSWSVDVSDWQQGAVPAFYVADAINQLDRVLSDAQGWQRTGITFQYMQNPEAGQIVFRPANAEPGKPQCLPIDPNDHQASCAAGSAVAGPQCTVRFSDQYELQIATKGYDKIWTQLINHEVGHCFGFDHTKGGVLNPGLYGENDQTLQTMYPSTDQIADVHRRLVGAGH